MPVRIENAVDLHCHFHVDSIGGFIPGQEAHQPVPALKSAREAVDQGYAAMVLKPHGFASPALAANLELRGRWTASLRWHLHRPPDRRAQRLRDRAGAGVGHQGRVASHRAQLRGLQSVHGRPAPHRPWTRADRGGRRPRRVAPRGAQSPRSSAEHDGVLATGHISRVSTRQSCAPSPNHERRRHPRGRARRAGTHCGRGRGARRPRRDGRDHRARRATRCSGIPGKPPEEVAAYLETIGPHRCILGTDYGLTANPASPGRWVPGVPGRGLGDRGARARPGDDGEHQSGRPAPVALRLTYGMSDAEIRRLVWSSW